MKTIQSLRVPYQKDFNLTDIAATHLGIKAEDISSVRVTKKSLDARGRQKYWVYSLEVFLTGEKATQAFEPFPKIKWPGSPPIIIGAGPAGLFAAWTFLAHGIKPILLEQGERTHPRMQKISRYWRQGILDTRSNVCHGEGGAGTFSDGKLITRIKSPHITRVMQALVEYGAPEEITYVYNPHVGSNLIRNVIKNMSDNLIARGGDLRFSTRMESLEIKNKKIDGVTLEDGTKLTGTGVILACGHSAGNLFRTLHQSGVFMEPKSFALGLRIEHPQELINKLQYRDNWCDADLESAQYKFAHHWERDNTGVYTFCMCPGGYVISSSTEANATVVNGMSNYHRNSPWANAAVVCTVDKDKIDGDSAFKMYDFQSKIERDVFEAAQSRGPAHRIPVQNLEDFLSRRESLKIPRSSCPSGVVSADIASLLPGWIYSYIAKGLLEFDKKRRGFAHPDALLHAVESRTSSPLRITRNPETMESISTEGLFPCGEGPGYAGGITSAAVDGMNAALAWIRKFT